MSHEIRTPINAIIGMNEMILRESNEVDTIKYAQNVSAASKNLLSMKRNKHIEGTELGLAITYKFVQMMNGWINVDSVYGEGSTFAVTIPQKIISNEVIVKFDEKLNSDEKQKKYTPSIIALNAKILVVDDNEMNFTDDSFYCKRNE